MSVVHGGFVGLWIRCALGVSICAFSSWIGMLDCLFTQPIGDRELLDRGVEGISAKKENGGR